MYAVQTMLNILSNMLPHMRVEWIQTLQPNIRMRILQSFIELDFTWW